MLKADFTRSIYFIMLISFLTLNFERFIYLFIKICLFRKQNRLKRNLFFYNFLKYKSFNKSI